MLEWFFYIQVLNYCYEYYTVWHHYISLKATTMSSFLFKTTYDALQNVLHYNYDFPTKRVGMTIAEANPGLSFRGGGRKRIWARAHCEREARSPLRPGSRARLGLWKLSGFLMLSRAIWALFFKHSDTKWEEKKTHSRSNFRGGGAPIAPPLNPPPTCNNVGFGGSKTSIKFS